MPHSEPLCPTSRRLWSPRAELAPLLSESGGRLRVESNGSEGCYGGWECVYAWPQAPFARVRVGARPRNLQRGVDGIHAAMVWGDEAYPRWEPLLPVSVEGDEYVYEGLGLRPPDATCLNVRLMIAWSSTGSIEWSEPEVLPEAAPAPRRRRFGVAGGPLPEGERSIAANTEAYLAVCREAAEASIDLLCLPEVMLTTGMPSSASDLLDQAIEIPGPVLEPFQDLAHEAHMALCFSAWERLGELVHNTAVLIGPDGALVGKYRKVHLASPYEVWWGVTPGHEFEVFDVGGCRVAMNICMDSSALESARVPARLGAEVLCMPIMGDHRAVTPWEACNLTFDPDRWLAIQRVRAMDNHLYMVISRNQGTGSCVIAPNGDVLARLDGGGIAWADVDLAELPRTWPGSSFRGTAWWERREPAYWPLTSGPAFPRP